MNNRNEQIGGLIKNSKPARKNCEQAFGAKRKPAAKDQRRARFEEKRSMEY